MALLLFVLFFIGNEVLFGGRRSDLFDGRVESGAGGLGEVAFLAVFSFQMPLLIPRIQHLLILLHQQFVLLLLLSLSLLFGLH